MRQIEEVANEIVEIKQEEDMVKKRLGAAREEFFELTAAALDDSELPVYTIEVPNEFFDKTGMDILAFIFSRFPSWGLLSVKELDDRKIITLQRDRQYIPSAVEVNGTKISKSVSEYTPTLDWNTLEKERPDIASRLKKPVTKYEIDEEALGELIGEVPELSSVLERHMQVKSPSLRLSKGKADGQE
jgi:hypothetical protein